MQEETAIWKTLSNWLWALLIIPVGMFWRKMDRAISREEHQDLTRRFEEHIEEDTRVHDRLFDKIDELKDLILQQRWRKD